MEIPKVLHALLSLKRPHGGAGEKIARTIVCDAIIGAGQEYHEDRHGNVLVQIGEDNGAVFTAHIDTVHRADGRLTVAYIEETGELVADDENGRACVLGADDAAGVFLLTEMIKHGVQGRYLFFVGEEVGGIGSSQFVTDNPNFSANFVISFDRKGKTDIITHQSYERTASDEFAAALANQLYKTSRGFLRYKPCNTGVYTDSKEFADIVPECTNVAVGYWNEHTVQESLELQHLLDLRDSLLCVDWAKLPIIRNPDPQPKYLRYGDDDEYSIEKLRMAYRHCKNMLEDDELTKQDVEYLLSILEVYI